MKDFSFKNFKVSQSKQVFRVGTDAVVLGVLVSVSDVKSVLEVGVGTGIISLMVAQRNSNAFFTGVEINPDAYQLAKSNFDKSPFSDRMKVVLSDFNEFKTEERFDLIISNPPYFEENTSSKDVLARQKVKLDFQQLISNSTKLLSENGKLALIVPVSFYDEIYFLAKAEGLFLYRKVNVFGIEGGDVKRVVLTFSSKEEFFVEEDFIIEKSPRKYSDHYLELTKEFHVFSK